MSETVANYDDMSAPVLSEREQELFDAFLAGWEASGEGFNGDYVNRCYRQYDAAQRELGRNARFLQRIRHEFATWRLGR